MTRFNCKAPFVRSTVAWMAVCLLLFLLPAVALPAPIKAYQAKVIGIADGIPSLKAYDPQSSLERGFCLLYDQNGHLVKSVQGLRTGQSLRTVLQDGRLKSTVQEIEGNKDDRHPRIQ